MKVFIVTEAGNNIGFGHLMRMLAIYQGFEEKGVKPKFIINADDSVSSFLNDTDYEIFNWLQDQNRLFEVIKDADIVFVDSYLADRELYEKISEIVKLPVYYDDNNRIEYSKGVVVNGNIHAKDLDYPKRDDIIYLLGVEYLPLRKEFWDLPEKVIKEDIESVMVTFGGDDSKDMTPKVLKILNERFPHLKKNVVIGNSFKNIEEIKEVADENTNLIYYPDAKKMRDIMLESDIAISAGGQTLYELARTGTPTIAIGVAENQKGNIDGFLKNGLILFAGWWNNEVVWEKICYYLTDLKSQSLRKKLNSYMKSFVEYISVKNLFNKLIGLLLENKR